MQKMFKFWGKPEDVEEFIVKLNQNGFNQIQEELISASYPKPNPERFAIFPIIAGIGAIVKEYLKSKRKILVVRENFGTRYEITGDWSPEEIERIIQASNSFNIEETPQPSPNSEPEMGFHVGIKPKEK